MTTETKPRSRESIFGAASWSFMKRVGGTTAVVVASVAGIPNVEAQEGAQAASSEAPLEEVVVTGFRGSLRDAIDVKRAESAIVDVIKAEDIADFPDLNLAESLQRIPGVAIDRDGGEGRSIVVRGLGPDFTRVRLNGLEALATTGGKDGSGGANRGRGFDFQVFASELFSSLTVRKAQSAEVEEGSLGATVDLQTARPFDYNGLVVAVSGQGSYNDLSRDTDPRGTLLLSNQFFDGRFGALLSLAYSERSTLEEGSSTGRWENGVTQSTGGRFLGLTATDPITLAFHPRIPRYGRLTYEQERLGLTTALQWRATDNTLVTLDGLYAKLEGQREEEYLEIISFSRGGQGNPRTTVVSATIDPLGNLIAGTFNDVDARSEQRRDVYDTTFSQLALNLEHEFSDRFKVAAIVGQSKSEQDNPIQTTVSIERYDTDGYQYDYRGDQRRPFFNYGFDVTNPNAWVFSPVQTQGDASLIRMRPNKTDNTFDTARLDLEFDLTERFSLKGGLAWKDYEFKTFEARRFTVGGVVEGAVPLPVGTSMSQITTLLTGFGRNLDVPAGTPTSWVVPSLDAIATLLDINCNCVNAFGDFRLSPDNQRGANRSVTETDTSAYIQLDFNFEDLAWPVRGNIGVRQVQTEQEATGFVGTTQVTVSQDYDDTLPSLNITVEARPDLLLRFGASKVMARPQLPNLSPGGSISTQTQTLTTGNPLLEPFRATTADFSIEWYPTRETLVSAGIFYKDIETFIQTLQTTVRFGDTGFPLTLLPASQNADTLYLQTSPVNSEGGPLKGFELSVQSPFTFLPGIGKNFGAILNYTRVESEIDYVLNTAGTAFFTADLVNLSKSSWNATLYFENERFSARVSGAYRDPYLSTVPGGSGNDVRGKQDSFNVDVAATYKLSDALSFTVEGINLTDQFDERYISSVRENSESFEHTGRQYFVGFRYRL